MVSPPYQGFCMSTLVDPCACRYDQHRGLFGNCPLACAYHVTLCFHAGRYLPLSNVWSTVVVGGGETRTAHIKQCVSKHRKEVHNGANPLHSPSLKNRKSHLALPSVRTLRQKPRARVELSGLNLSLLTATIALYHNLLECCQVLFKIFSFCMQNENCSRVGLFV